jgi:hypothetical protein
MLAVIAVLHASCALRSADVQPLRTDPAEFGGWPCERIEEELDHVQRQATHVAYAFDERAGNNIIAMGLGLAVFWPAFLTMRPQGPDATVLAALKGRHDALRSASADKQCVPSAGPWPDRAGVLPVAVGDRLVYEQRATARAPLQSLDLRVSQLRRDEIQLQASGAATLQPWVTDRTGNLLQAPVSPVWPALLRQELKLGQTVGGMLRHPEDTRIWARVRGQVVAVGPQTIGGVDFDVAVIDLFGDAHEGEISSRLDGVLVVDRVSGLHLRLDLFSGHAAWQLQRRLVRVERSPSP